jgi:hypothetical protein
LQEAAPRAVPSFDARHAGPPLDAKGGAGPVFEAESGERPRGIIDQAQDTLRIHQHRVIGGGFLGTSGLENFFGLLQEDAHEKHIGHGRRFSRRFAKSPPLAD